MDRIRNEVHRDEIKVEVIMQRGQLKWLGHVARVGEEKMARKTYEAKEDEIRKRRRPRKTWMEDVRKVKGEKWEGARKMCKGREKWR